MTLPGWLGIAGQAEHPFRDDIELNVGRAAANGLRPAEQQLLAPVPGLVVLAVAGAPAWLPAGAERAVRPGQRPAALADLLGMPHAEQLAHAGGGARLGPGQLP